MVKLKLVARLTDIHGNPLSNKTIEFYRRTTGSYTLIATGTTNESGEADTVDEVTAYGTYYYKARFPGDPDYEASEAEASYTYSFDWSIIAQIIYAVITIIILVFLAKMFMSFFKEEE